MKMKQKIHSCRLPQYNAEDYRKYVVWWSPVGICDIRWLKQQEPFFSKKGMFSSLSLDADLDAKEPMLYD